MPLLRTFCSIFLRVPAHAEAPATAPALERKWPPPAAAQTDDWETQKSAPPMIAACIDLEDEESSTLDRDTSEEGPLPTVLRRPRATRCDAAPSSRAPVSAPLSSASFEFPDHSAAAGAMWPDDEDQAFV